MRRRGITLIELAIALSIVVVLSSVLIIRVAGWTPRQALRASARSVGNAVRTWRERARLEERVYRLRFEAGGWEVSDGAGERMAQGTFPRGQVLSGAATLAFDSRGIVPPTRLVLRNGGGEQIEIVVDPVLNNLTYVEAR